jgi:hypothetical protein
MNSNVEFMFMGILKTSIKIHYITEFCTNEQPNIVHLSYLQEIGLTLIIYHFYHSLLLLKSYTLKILQRYCVMMKCLDLYD